MGYLPPLPVVFETPPSPFLKYSCIFVALQPFFVFFLRHEEVGSFHN